MYDSAAIAVCANILRGSAKLLPIVIPDKQKHLHVKALMVKAETSEDFNTRIGECNYILLV